MSRKNHEGSLHGGSGSKKRVKGVVDRVTGGIVVVLIRDPDNPEEFKEIFIPLAKFKNHTPQEGDYIAVDIENKN